MFWSLFHGIAMVALFVYMIRKAQFAQTKKVALVPLATGFVDLLAAGLLNPGHYPVLTILLAAMRLTIVGCCVLALRQDAAMTRQKARRRAQRRRMQIAEVAQAAGEAQKSRNLVSFQSRCA